LSPSAKAHSFWKIFSSASQFKTIIKFDKVIEEEEKRIRTPSRAVGLGEAGGRGV
jgi:hypothetical protein